MMSSDSKMNPEFSTENPPPYASASSALSSSSPGDKPPSISRCNLLAITRKDRPIEGIYVIDPDMEVPEAMLATLKEGEERKNLDFKTKGSYSTIDADIWIVEETKLTGAARDVKPKTTTIELQGSHVLARIHPTTTRPFFLHAVAKGGNLTVEIPPTYRGPLTIDSKRPVHLSPALTPLVSVFSDVDDIKKCFVGNAREDGFGSGEWLGSSIDLKCKDYKVTLRLLDEIESKRPSWTEKCFGAKSSSSK